MLGDPHLELDAVDLVADSDGGFLVLPEPGPSLNVLLCGGSGGVRDPRSEIEREGGGGGSGPDFFFSLGGKGIPEDPKIGVKKN